jgi:DNA polymerase III alpha subunit
MPDIDMDFEDTRRGDVIRHVTKNTARSRWPTSRLSERWAPRRLSATPAAALALPMPDVDRLARMVPSLPVGITIDRAMQDNPEFGAEYTNNETARKLVDTAKRLEGISRHASVHAAGIMIADRPLVEYTPLAKTADGSLVTQYPHSSLEAIGLLKMDFLGLSNLSILARAVKLIQETRGETIDVGNFRSITTLTSGCDAPTRCSGGAKPTGIFQLESQGMRKYIVDLKPNSVKELAAMVALYRPGPMAHIPRYIRCKFDPVADRVHAPAAGADPARHLRRHRLPGPGPQDRPGDRRLYARVRPTFCAAPWARKRRRRWKSSATTSSVARRRRAIPRRSRGHLHRHRAVSLVTHLMGPTRRATRWSHIKRPT